MRAITIGIVLLLAGCATPAQKLANDQCHGHWRVVTTQVHGKTIYSAVCAGSKP
jgi:hypothetical protein